MGDKSDIQWTDATANVVVGCSRVSDGCRHCYAEQLAGTRLKNTKRYKGLAIVTAAGRPQWTGEARLVVDAIEQVIRWKRPRRIFLTAMGDPFHESLSNEQIVVLFGLMAVCPQHTFQVLTKRARRMREWFAWAKQQIDLEQANGRWTPFIRALVDVIEDEKLAERIQEDGIARANDSEAWPLPNVWLGVSVESQAVANERIPELLATPAAVHFLSCEPLLEALDLENATDGERCEECRELVRTNFLNATQLCGCTTEGPEPLACPAIDWVIVGGESGHRARPFDLAWARSIVGQCKAAGTAVFVKQLGLRAQGSWLPDGFSGRRVVLLQDCRDPDPSKHRFFLDHPSGADPSEWPEDLRVQEFPTVGGAS